MSLDFICVLCMPWGEHLGHFPSNPFLISYSIYLQRRHYKFRFTVNSSVSLKRNYLL
jgi:hypothetical protein